MPDPSVPPPLKVTQAGGTSYLPVLELVLSGGTVTKLSPIKVQYNPTATTGVAASRQILTTYPLAGGGDLSIDRTHTVDTAFVVISSRTLTSVFPLSGGGDLSANRIFSVSTGGLLVLSSRTITTLYPLSGGRNLGADMGIGVDTAFLVTSARAINAGSGLSGGGNLGSDQTFSVNTNVRDKALGFFFAGALATTALAVNARAYIPFPMQLLQVRLAAQTAPTGESIIINPLQYNAALGASTAIFAATNRPMVVGGVTVGSDNATFAITSLFAGSWLGVNLDQVGATNAGSNLTITFVVRSS